MENENGQALKKILGANIRKARRRLGITQEQMAELLEMSPEVYGRMERGLIFPRVERLVDICRTLSESSDRLLGLSVPGAAIDDAATGQDEYLSVLRGLKPLMPRLTQPQRQAVLRHLGDLVKFIIAFQGSEQAAKGRRRRVPTQ